METHASPNGGSFNFLALAWNIGKRMWEKRKLQEKERDKKKEKKRRFANGTVVNYYTRLDQDSRTRIF